MSEVRTHLYLRNLITFSNKKVKDFKVSTLGNNFGKKDLPFILNSYVDMKESLSQILSVKDSKEKLKYFEGTEDQFDKFSNSYDKTFESLTSTILSIKKILVIIRRKKASLEERILNSLEGDMLNWFKSKSVELKSIRSYGMIKEGKEIVPINSLILNNVKSSDNYNFPLYIISITYKEKDGEILMYKELNKEVSSVLSVSELKASKRISTLNCSKVLNQLLSKDNLYFEKDTTRY